MGLSKRDMIPVTMRMKAANNGDIAILGAILVRVRGFDRTGAAVETKQMCYITDGADRIFLNRDALTDLQVVSADFPTIGESTRSEQSATMSASQPEHPTVACSCPTREPPPPPPTSLPPGLPATEDNVAKLKSWLLA